ncbi:bys1 protein [Fusarium longipes]|uniref:Bys1 protein n=1 Tax=Fusarium longipes TaxID=694270 RepID=A0A395T850_9HYPO|nr:bys1 protein [Fusarium longipes]
MKFSILATLTALVSSATAANQAIVINDCSTTIYVQSFPYNGAAPGPLTALKPGQKFAENMRSSGSTVKIATSRTLTKPLFFGYSSSSSPNYVYYEFSTQYGNPFANKHNILSPGSGCKKFDCRAGQASCYSTPSMKKVFGCPSPTTVTATICAK